MSQTEHTFVLTGWLPKKQIRPLADKLQQSSQLLWLVEISPEAGEIPPTLLSNPAVFGPFEVITRIFGLPQQKEIDPTAPLSFFYLLFFAICLSDVGYGLLLAIISYFLLKKLTLSEGGKNIVQLLFWGGLAASLIGVATGSYFAIDLQLLPEPWRSGLKSLQLIDPIKSPLNVLLMSLALGVIQNLVGLSLAMYWKIRQREFVSAIIDDGLWLYFLTALVSYIIIPFVAPGYSELNKILVIIGAALLVLTQGRAEKGLIKKAIFGLLSLYRTTSYLGDTLSYSRLLALMMTTSIIGMVINIIAGLTSQSIPVVGYLIMIVILIIGHLFNLVVSVLGAFIHAARLQLVEFFGKFYVGGGREFKPFRPLTKYVIID